MQELDDITLLRRYSNESCEQAFATLVERHVNKVYSVALRHTRNPHQAEEITQAVFVVLARKSRSLAANTILAGWLCQTTRLIALAFIRSETRRVYREQEAYMQNSLREDESEMWVQIAPLLDAAMETLSQTDHHAVVLRFFDDKSMKQIDDALGASEDAAKMRINRAVEKMRLYFKKRGLALSATALAAALSAHSIQAAPLTLAHSVTAIAFTKGSASGSTLAMIKSALKIMAWGKLKAAAAVGAAIFLAAGTTTLVIRHESQMVSKSSFPRASWTFAGYATPEATLKTFAWAVSRTNGQTLFATLSPECLEEFQDVAKEAQPRTPPDKYWLSMLNRQLSHASRIGVLNSRTLSSDELLLDLGDPGEWSLKPHEQWILMRKMDGAWKIDDFDPLGPNSRAGTALQNVEYGGVGIGLEADTNHTMIRIAQVLPDSAAAKAKLTPGLLLQKINWRPITGKTAAECVFQIRGRAGSRVWLEFVDPALNRTNTVELRRERFVL